MRFLGILLVLIAFSQAAEAAQEKLEVGMVGLFSVSSFNRPDPIVLGSSQDPTINGFNLQEFELNLKAPIDATFEGDASLAFTENSVLVEEATMRAANLPAGIQFKGGEFLTDFGLDNPTHQHDLEFVNRPLVAGRFFGGRQLRNPGIESGVELPENRLGHLRVTVSAQDSTGESAVSFLGPRGVAMRGPVHYLYLVRLQDSLTIKNAVIEVGGSAATGPNESTGNSQTLGGRTNLFGADLQLHFLENTMLSRLSLMGEYMRRNFLAPSGLLVDDGVYLEALYNLNRWTAGLRLDFVSNKNPPVNVSNQFSDNDLQSRLRYSPVITYYPSDYSKLRFQFDYDSLSTLSNAQQVLTVQYAFSIGSHGARKL